MINKGICEWNQILQSVFKLKEKHTQVSTRQWACPWMDHNVTADVLTEGGESLKQLQCHAE